MDRLVALAMKRAPKKAGGGSDAQLAQRLLKAIAENDKSVTSVEIGASQAPEEGSPQGENDTGSALDANGNLVSSSYLDSTLACGLIRAIEDNRYVHSLTIKGRNDPSDLIPAVASLLHHSHALSYIRLSDMHIDDDLGMVLMGSLAKNLSITTAVLSNLGLTSTDGISMLLKHNDVLTSLDLSYNDFGGQGDEAFAELAESLRDVTSSKLTELRFAHTNLSDASLNRICCVLEESPDYCPALKMFDFGSGEGAPKEAESNSGGVAAGDETDLSTSIGVGNSRYTILEYTRQRLVAVLDKRREGARRVRRVAAPRTNGSGLDMPNGTDKHAAASYLPEDVQTQLQERAEEVEQGKRNVAEMQKSLDAARAETLTWKKKQQTALKEKDDAIKRANESRAQASQATAMAEGVGAEKERSLEESSKEVQDAYNLVAALKSQLEEVLKAHSRLKLEHASVQGDRDELLAENVALRNQYRTELHEAIAKIAAIPTEQPPQEVEAAMNGVSSEQVVDVATQTDLIAATVRDRRLSVSFNRRSSNAVAEPSVSQKKPQSLGSGFGTAKFGAYADPSTDSFEHVDSSGLAPHYASAPQLDSSEKPKWKDDKFAPNCAHCQKEFTLLNRKHHCRRCGDVYCDRCCSKSKLHDNERICSHCAAVPLQLSDY